MEHKYYTNYRWIFFYNYEGGDGELTETVACEAQGPHAYTIRSRSNEFPTQDTLSALQYVGVKGLFS